MVKSVDFAVRDVMGGVTRGLVAGEGASDFIQVGAGDDISLNLRKTSILKYVRDGNDLQVVLVDGRTVTLSGYFDAQAKLYISADGELTPVTLEDGGDGVIYADYAPAETVGKWSPNDQLAFLGGDDLLAPAGSDDTTGMAMFAPAMLGLGGLGAAGAGLAGLGLLGLGGGDSSGGGSDTTPGGDGGQVTPVVPTVNNPDANTTLTSNTPDPAAPVSGTGEPGSTVTVTLGDQTQETTIGPDGTWEVSFEGDSFPSDGDLTSTVVVTAPDGTVHELDGPDFLIDMQPPAVAISAGAQSTGDVENLLEYQNGITIRGTAEPGAAIVVTVAGHSQSTVATDGIWEVTFTTAQLPAGTYTQDMTVTATDAVGNVTTLADKLVVDTEASVAFGTGAVTSDNVINATEARDGFVLSGTSEPGSVSVVVTLGGVAYSAVPAADGSWSMSLSGVALGTGDHVARVTATDAHGNTASATRSLAFDTEASVAFASTQSGSDNLINGAERSAGEGVVLRGNADPGSTVVVTFESGTRTEIADADGNWSARFYANEIRTGTYTSTATVTATDPAGNIAPASHHVIAVDTEVRSFALGTSVTGDNVVNAQEGADGFAISGAVEPGSTLTIRLANGVAQTVQAGADGQWSATFHSDDLGANATTGTMAYRVTATDPVGNVAWADGSFAYDLVVPESPLIEGFSRDAGSLLGIRTDAGEGTYDISAVDAAGRVSDVVFDPGIKTTLGYDRYDFASSVPNGSYLVVTDEDSAGNATSTLLVVDNTAAVTVDLARAGLGGFDFGSIDLTFAPEANLTITEAQLQALTGPDQTLVIHGDAADKITALGAQDTGRNTVIDGESYSIYTLGDDGASLVIDDQITQLTL